METKGKFTTTNVTIEKKECEGYAEEHKHIPVSSNSSLGTPSGIKELALKPTKFYVDKIDIWSGNLRKSRKVYNKLGQFDYDIDYAEDFGEEIGSSNSGQKFIYVGQFKKGSNKIGHGISIIVWDSGLIYEGFWKNNKKHGIGRKIEPSGAYYDGEWQNNKQHGQGVEVSSDGTRTVGEWKEDKKVGEHTEYSPNGSSKKVTYSS
mmetsp:Transcript_19053/g.21942  ORF Transcript_19053/g.21942 Transcript_19053/m.21942 type:complete len:205 (-) Transcript_19053:24-638(-)